MEVELSLKEIQKKFSTEQIEELKPYVTDIAKRAFGLPQKQIATVCFEIF